MTFERLMCLKKSAGFKFRLEEEKQLDKVEKETYATFQQQCRSLHNKNMFAVYVISFYTALPFVFLLSAEQLPYSH